ncbi:2-dehydro-3-deoxygalactonokinase [Labrenzia sp. CE80]|uniref:2-dehydro-3-deoxygalactonokinase n=1 Tax=Labrenzia sp. CE80 TaxID=1788986 RepID=UPI00129B069B|nr:2-dehydro-3-deoxygalactonokinase [Labrenzia sp. CE80]
MNQTSQIDWIAVDWGTTNLRVWLMSAANEVLAQHQSQEGMGTLAKDQFEPALLHLIAQDLPPGKKTNVVVCGMAGSRQGWAEAPYLTAPCPPPSAHQATHVSGTDPRLSVYLLPGVKQTGPEDVMRGEETQIAGLLSDKPSYDGMVCLPGTHTKWASIDHGKIRSFQTFMTGELFSLLSQNSVLRHGIEAGELDLEEFRHALRHIGKDPSALAAELFRIRAKGLIAGLSPSKAFSRLSGLLIGAELAAVGLSAETTSSVIILGEDRVAQAYRVGLEALGLSSTCISAESATLRGLILAHASLKEAAQ